MPWGAGVGLGPAPSLTITVTQAGGSLTIVENSSSFAGSFTSATTVAAFGLTGTVSADAKTINWSNGGVWLKQ